jgi:two-component system, response regulator YesN
MPWTEAEARTFTYALIEWNDVHPWRGISMPSKDVLKGEIRKAIQSASRSNLEPILFGHSQAFGFIVPDIYFNAYDGSDRAFYENVLAQLTDRLFLAFRIYSGPIVGSSKQLKRAYNGAKDTMQYKYLKHSDLVILHADIEGVELNCQQLTDEIFLHLIQAVEDSTRYSLSIAVEGIFNDIQENRFSPDAMKVALVQCILGVVNSIRSMEGDEKELVSLKPIINWFSYNISLDELKRLFELFAWEASYMIDKLQQTYGKAGGM